MDTISEKVKSQYEALPYPFRRPEDEALRLVPTVGDNLHSINHYCFQGKQSFQNEFNCLVAGGGTGDSLIYLAQQLKPFNATITYLDMSTSSREIAEQRAAARSLTNIRWITGSIQDIPGLELPPFDYINCSGVLHHMENPQHGLDLLTGLLKDTGAIYLMLYATYGRSSVYQMQRLLKDLFDSNESLQEKIKQTRMIIDNLPDSNPFKRDFERWQNELDFSKNQDAGLVDLLLHPQDRAYTVDEIYQLADKSDLQLIDFVGPDKNNYSLKHLLNDQKLLKLLSKKSGKQQRCIAENIHGGITKHQFYLSKQKNTQASIDDLSNSLILTQEMAGKHLQIAKAIQPGKILTLNYELEGKTYAFKLQGTQSLKLLFLYFDGKTPLSEAIKNCQKQLKNINKNHLEQEIRSVFNLFHSMGWGYLRRV